MSGTTPWYASKTIWGSIIAVGAGIATVFGLKLDAPLQDQLGSLLASAGEIAGGLLAFYGRVVASTKLG